MLRDQPTLPEGRTDVIIYHNPACGTSRNTLGLIRNVGIEPHVIEYLKTPPSRAMLKNLIARMGVGGLAHSDITCLLASASNCFRCLSSW